MNEIETKVNDLEVRWIDVECRIEGLMRKFKNHENRNRMVKSNIQVIQDWIEDYELVHGDLQAKAQIIKDTKEDLEDDE